MNYVRLIIYRNYNYDISFPGNNKNINAKFRKLADLILVDCIYTEITFLHLEMNLRIAFILHFRFANPFSISIFGNFQILAFSILKISSLFK